jgi:hypothetical protein
MIVVKLSALRTGRLYPQEISLVYVRRWIDPRGHSAAGRIMSMKNSNDIIGNGTRDIPALRHRVTRLLFGTQHKSTVRRPRSNTTADHPWPCVRETRFCIFAGNYYDNPRQSRCRGPSPIRGRTYISARRRTIQAAPGYSSYSTATQLSRDWNVLRPYSTQVYNWLLSSQFIILAKV